MQEHSLRQGHVLTLLQSQVRVPFSDTRQFPRLLQFMGHLYLETEIVYLQVLESSPFTPTNHFPAIMPTSRRLNHGA